MYKCQQCESANRLNETSVDASRVTATGKIVPQKCTCQQCKRTFWSHSIGLASATSQPRNRRSNRQIGSKQSQRPIQKHAGRSSIDRKTTPHLSDPRYLLKCDGLSCEEVVKTVQTSPRRKESFAQWETFFPSMLLYGTRSLFRTNFPRCHALLSFWRHHLQALLRQAWTDQKRDFWRR